MIVNTFNDIKHDGAIKRRKVGLSVLYRWWRLILLTSATLTHFIPNLMPFSSLYLSQPRHHGLAWSPLCLYLSSLFLSLSLSLSLSVSFWSKYIRLRYKHGQCEVWFSPLYRHKIRRCNNFSKFISSDLTPGTVCIWLLTIYSEWLCKIFLCYLIGFTKCRYIIWLAP